MIVIADGTVEGARTLATPGQLARVKPGSVVAITVMLRDRDTGGRYPWRRFAAVTKVYGKNRRGIATLTLKLRPEPRDARDYDLGHCAEKIELLEEHELPPGVVAMLMKHIHTGLIRLETDDA